MKRLLFLLNIFLFTFSGSLFGQGSQTNIPCPSGTVSTTLPASGFSGDDPTTATGSCGQCCYAGSDLDGDGDQDVSFSVENSKWFKFCNSGATTLTQTFTVDETANDCNLQGAIFVGSSTNPNNASIALDVDCSNTYFSEYGSNVSGNADGFSFSNIDIATGQCAYIMVDGYAGATCTNGFTISTSCTVCTAPTSITESADITICEGSSTGLSATAVGGVIAASPGTVYYRWTPTTSLTPSTGIGSAVTAAPTGTTTYTVTACNDGVGTTCCTTDNVIVTVTPTFTANAGTDITSCAPSNVTIGGSPTGPAGSTYSWVETGANANIAISGSSTVANPTVAISAGATGSATYTVTVTNGACVRTDAVTVTVGTLAVSAGPDITVCAGQSVTIGGAPTAPAGSTYAWTVVSANDADLAISGSTAIANPTVATVASGSGSETYRVTATLSGCSNTDDVIVTLDPLPTTPTATASPATVCAGTASTLTAAGGAGAGTYSWWTASTGGTLLGTGNTLAVSPTATTTYYIASTNATTLCESLRGSVTVTVTATPVANAGADRETCSGTSFALAGTITNPGACAPVQTWSVVSGSGTFSNANSLTSNFTPTSAGSITLRLTPCSPGGCTPVSDDIVISVNPSPVLTAAPVSDTLCPTQITDLAGNATGGTPEPDAIVTNSFTSSAGTSSIPDNTASGVSIPLTVSGITNGTLGATDIASVTVNIDHNRIGQVEVYLCPPGTASAPTGCVQLFDNTGGNGDDMVNTVFSDAGTTDIAAGSPPYTGTFNLTGANVLTSLDGSATNGTWTLFVRDNSGAGSTTGTVGNWSMSFNTSTPPANPYTYSWANGTGLSVTNDAATTLSASSFAAPATVTKTLTVTDSKGCTDSEPVVVRILATPTATITAGTTQLCATADALNVTDHDVNIDFTGIGPWTFTPVEDGASQAQTVSSSDPYPYNITYADISGLGDQTMVVTVTGFSDKYCPGTVSGSHTLTVGCVLPVELVSFTGEYVSRKNYLNWISGSEINNDYYLIEKSADGTNYETLTSVPSYGNGSSSSAQTYNYIDSNPLSNKTYYRLHQVDLDGETHELATLVIYEKANNLPGQVLPNPASDYAHVNYYSDINQVLSIELIDVYGHVLSSQSVAIGEGKNDSLLDLRNLSNGMYYILLKGQQSQEMVKFMKVGNK